MRRAYHLLMQASGVAAALVIGVVVLLVTVDVVGRNIGLGGLPWAVEVSEYSLPLATFLAAPWLLYRNEHVRIDILLTTLPRGAARQIDRAADAVGLAVCLVFVWYGIKVIADSMHLGSMIIKTLVIPEWWTFVPVPICFALLGVEFVRRMLTGSSIVSGQIGSQ
ncbi:MAG TPA: TRAP transporter small permease [Burkholderiales bacterium]|nr:TRAP transporter small permease [Burkholderiales bacterium]